MATYPAMSRQEQEEERQHALRVQRSLRTIQERADDCYQPWGFRAPGPTLGCDPDEYRRDLLIKAKRLLPGDNELRRVQVRQLPRSALSQFEDMIFAAAKAEAFRPDSVPDGEMRKVVRPTANGSEIIEWVGKTSFVKAMGRPGRKVLSFNTAAGPMDSSGRFMR
jgi:hypothetical protein